MSNPSPWHPITDPELIAIIGKTGEEAGELISALMRCLIQGIDEVEPVTGKPNREWLAEECADMAAGLMHIAELLQTDPDTHTERAWRKFNYQREWHRMIREGETE